MVGADRDPSIAAKYHVTVAPADPPADHEGR